MIEELLEEILAGCPWSRTQTIETLRKYLLEEANEVADAIDKEDFENLQEELGDLLYNIVYISKLSEQKGHFSFKDVEKTLCEKLKRRHPHVFADDPAETLDEIREMWLRIKADEKKQKGL